MCAISLALALSSSSPFFSSLLLSPLLDPHCHFPLPLHPSLFISFSFFPFFFYSAALSPALPGPVSLSRPPPFLDCTLCPAADAAAATPPAPHSLSILSPLCLLISVHPSISVRRIWCCVIVSASPLGWRLSKGPQDPHTPRVSSHARDALSLLSSSPLSSHSYQFIWPLSSSRRDGGKVTSPASLPVHSYNQSAHFAEHPLKIFQIVRI